jgi:hypothetical protein
MAPSRASAERRGVKLPKWRGVNPTTIIARTDFKTSLTKTNDIFADFVGVPKSPLLILAVFPNPANRLANGAGEVAPCRSAREIPFCVRELAG